MWVLFTLPISRALVLRIIQLTAKNKRDLSSNNTAFAMHVIYTHGLGFLHTKLPVVLGQFIVTRCERSSMLELEENSLRDTTFSDHRWQDWVLSARYSNWNSWGFCVFAEYHAFLIFRYQFAPFSVQVYVPQHPLLGHWLSIARNKLASSPIFRSSVGEIGRILIYEASNDWLPVLEGQVETPLAIAESRWIDCEKPVKVIVFLFYTLQEEAVRERWLESWVPHTEISKLSYLKFFGIGIKVTQHVYLKFWICHSIKCRA